MTLVQKIRHQVPGNISVNEKGVVLIAVLVLLTTLILVGTTAFIVSSTDVKVGGNYKMNQTALQVAMAGAEKAREALRAANAASTNTSNFSEELAARVGANGLLNGYTSTTDDSPIATSSSLAESAVPVIGCGVSWPRSTRLRAWAMINAAMPEPRPVASDEHEFDGTVTCTLCAP